MSTGLPDLSEGAVDELDLSNCDREPIHTPGSIQPHGFLLALSGPEDDLGARVVTHASESAATFLGRPLASILGATLGSLLPASSIERLIRQFQAARPSATAEFALTAPLVDAAGAPHFEIVSYRSGDLLVLEFESESAPLDMDALNADLYSIILRIPTLGGLGTISAVAARQLRRLTGFDRALLYRFDPDGSCIVLAEDRNERLPSYLHLRFPASDVPRQARRLYALNRVRIIPDVDYTPSPLRAAADSEAATLDLSGSILRSVSPIHREYMRNMGTIASMSVSIVLDGELWGLISLHHSEPRHVAYRLRASCDLLVQFFAAQIAAELKASRLARTVELRTVQRRLLTAMATEDRYLYSLTEHAKDLLDLTSAQGAALVLGRECTLVGRTPSADEVLRIADWLLERGERHVFVTPALSALLPEAMPWATTASGLLAISISNVHGSYLLWFRPEQRETIEWAGEPAKQVQVEPGRLVIHPRKSFETWTETVRGKARPWEETDIEAATELRSAIIQIVLRRAEEMADIAAELEFANKELEAFSYSVSHDLRAPFRHISGFSELLLEEERDRLSERGRRYLNTIIESTRFAGLLVETLLNFSRIGRSKIAQNQVDMNELAHAAWGDVYAQEAMERPIQLTVEPLPTVRGDLNLLRQVLINFFSNAIKYTRNVANPEVHVGVELRGRDYIFSIRDNGVGFDQQYAHKLFGVFQRLHRTEEYEGTGIGLANIQRIVTRHGGRVYAQGEVGKGATFFFTLPVR